MKNKRKDMHTKILGIGIMCIVLIATAVVWYVDQTTPKQVPATTIYTSKSNTFKITIPTQWQTQDTIAVQTTGLRTPHPVTRDIEVTQMYTPDGAGITVQVYEDAPSCPWPQQPTTILAGLPAVYNQQKNEWTIYTTTSMIVVRGYYPGVGIFHRAALLTPTSVPQAMIDAYKESLTRSLATLQFNNLKPLTCQ